MGLVKGLFKLAIIFDIGWEVQGLAIIREILQKDINKQAQELSYLTTEENMLGFISLDHLPIFLSLKMSSPVSFEEFKVSEDVSLSIHQQGVMRVIFSIPFEGTLEQLAKLSSAVSSSAGLLVRSKEMVSSVFKQISEYVVDPSLSKDFEDYFTFEFLDWGSQDLESFMKNEKLLLAQIIQGERENYLDEKITEALSVRVFPSKDKLAIVGWSGALLFGEDASAGSFVLQLANIWLLELKQFYRKLEKVSAEIDRERLRQGPLSSIFRGFASSRITELRVDSLVMLSRNESDVVRDEYLWEISNSAVGEFGIGFNSEKVVKFLDEMTEIEGEDAARSREFANLTVGLLLGAVLTAIATLLGTLFAG